MVFLVDSGSVFDVPLDLVWKFVGSGDGHSRAHGHRVLERTIFDPHHGRYAWEQEFDGRTTPFTMEWWAFPPLGVAYQVQAGPFEGSRFFLYYEPIGSRTAVTIVGEFRSPTLAEAAIRPAVERFFAREFEQDDAAIRALRDARPV